MSIEILSTFHAGDTAVLSMAEIEAMVNEMFQQNRDHLPQFKHFTV